MRDSEAPAVKEPHGEWEEIVRVVVETVGCDGDEFGACGGRGGCLDDREQGSHASFRNVSRSDDESLSERDRRVTT